MNKLISALSAFMITGFLAVPFVAGATNMIPNKDTSSNTTLGADRFNNNGLENTLNVVSNYVVGILIIVAIFYILWAAYDFVTSSGSEEKVNGARRKIMYAAIGIIIALLAKGIVGLVLGATSK